MKFGPIATTGAAGAILAHSLQAGPTRLRKGITLTPEHLDQLRLAGIEEVIVARLDPGDLHENDAAAALAAALVPDPAAANLRVTQAFTGRVNLIAAGPGVVRLDATRLQAVNAIDPMITIATVPPFQQMAEGGMVATIKVISFAVGLEAVERACAAIGSAPAPALSLEPPRHRSAGLVITQVPGGPDDSKGRRVIAARLAALGLTLSEVREVPHRRADLAAALTVLPGDLALILTGSATMDIDDVAPAALRDAGGRVDRFGMPVDPGNLLFLGDLAGRPVIGLPGCARSPALNGADWVLSRVACGISVSAADIAGMGVGGLLKEIPTRPQPRAAQRRASQDTDQESDQESGQDPGAAPARASEGDPAPPPFPG